MANQIQTLNLENLFESGKYVIPIYQRNYAWSEPEITQLIQDIYDFSVREDQNSNYYIGSLVVYNRKKNDEIVFETIDGQQRLTTLNIILSVIHREFETYLKEKIKYTPNLVFDSRKKSTDTLEVITKNTPKLEYLYSKEYNSELVHAYDVIKKVLNRIIGKNDNINSFYKFLTKKVHIMRVSVPEDTDLNHYFEIMNNRGEQLEKHEILKAKMLQFLKDSKELSYAFNLIWESCSDMERYIQYGFIPSHRSLIFSEKNWNNLICSNLDEIAKIVYTEDNKEKININIDYWSLTEIAFSKSIVIKPIDTTTNTSERFSSIINFPNFLIHVLKAQTKENISLDDKQLLDIFNNIISGFGDDQARKIDFVKLFGFNLLKCKWLFDNYIIKREYTSNQDQWSLKQLKYYEGDKVNYVNTFGLEDQDDPLNREILMIQAMFHVSSPTLVYKHWLSAALIYVFYKSEVSANDYLNYLKNLAKAYLFDRYLAKNSTDFYDIIHINHGKSINFGKPDLYDEKLLNKGTEVENFIFNYLDYILWTMKDDRYSKFEFGFRSSVEHYYPQNPIADSERIDEEFYNLFGNLCLISSSKNSRLSNNLPSAKKDYYIKVNPDSLKQEEMMKVDPWDIQAIKVETERMTKILLEFN